MKPTLLIDKSALQSLSNDEIYFLHKYYYVNIPPILVQEILADLAPKAENKMPKEPPEEKVKGLFNKILLGESGINVEYHDLIISELKGIPVPMIRKTIRAADMNEFEVLISETEAEKKVSKYQQGIFSSQDYEIAREWRSSIAKIDVDKIRKMSSEFIHRFNNREIKKLETLLYVIHSYLSVEESQHKILQLVIEICKISQEEASAIFYRWESHDKPLLSQFCPYSLFCTHALMLWHFGTSKGIFGRDTDILDLEYVFYLPFTQVFASNDKFHKAIIPFLIKENQIVITGEVLRKDFKAVVDTWSSLDDNEKLKWHKIHGNYPTPDTPLTLKLWNDCSLFQQSDNISTPDEVEFMEIRKQININDPCPCGSGIPYVNCSHRING